MISISRLKKFSFCLPEFGLVTALSVLSVLASPGDSFPQTDSSRVRPAWVHILEPLTTTMIRTGIVELYPDRQGNTYTLGLEQHQADFENGTYADWYHLVVRKYDGFGQAQWTNEDQWLWGHKAWSLRGQIVGDPSDNVYLVAEHGWESAFIYDEGVTVLSRSGAGGFRWSNVYDGPAGNSVVAQPPCLVLGNDKRVYVLCSGPRSDYDVRLLIYDSSGQGPAIVTYGNPLTDSLPFPCMLRVDSRGFVYLFGTKSGSAWAVKHAPGGEIMHESILMPGTVLDAAFDGSGNSYCLVGRRYGGVLDYYRNVDLVKLDTSMSLIWQTHFTDIGAEQYRVLVDHAGNITAMTAPGGSVEGAAIKYRPDSSRVWEKTWPVAYFDPLALAGDRAGNLYSLNGNGTLQSFDPDGNSRWLINPSPDRPVTGINRDHNRAVLRVDDAGDIYVSAVACSLDSVSYNLPDDNMFVCPTLVGKYTQPKTLVILDGNGDSIPNMTFELIRVHATPPLYVEDTLGAFSTDIHGQIILPFAASEGYELPQSAINSTADVINLGDTLKISRLVYTQLSPRHSTVAGTMYTILLDNGEFLEDGALVFDTCSYSSYQEIKLDHTEYRYNLLVSIEWDAEESYVQGLTADFRQMSNYLYDVSDGQIRLDTVVILDDRSQWNEADIQIKASNVYWPNAGIMGIAWTGFPPIKLPRKWFGDPDTCRVFSYLLHPLSDGMSDNYRTLGHEFGHYGLGFSDEYLFVDPAGHYLPANARCGSLPSGNYGFMDHHYDRPYFGELASEMSSEYRYQDGSCRNSAQWYDNSRSCWDDFERWAEGPRNGIYVPILKPSVTDSTERLTPTGLNYFPGPNDDLYNLTYDVGRLVHFPAALVPPAPGIQSVHLKVDTVTPGGLNVQLLRRGANPMYQSDQGFTTDRGQLWVYGMDFFQDEILVAGSSRTESIGKRSPGAVAGVRKAWLCGSVRPGSGFSRTGSQSAASVAGDSVTLSLRPVAGDFPMVCGGQLSDNGWTYGLWFDRGMSQYPQLDIVTDQGDFVTSTFSAGTNSYSTQAAEYLTVPGKATVWGVDDSSETFFFSTPFEVTNITTPRQLQKLIGPEGEAIVRIDSSNSGIQRAMILSSAYPPWLSGLGAGAIQGGKTHSLSTSPFNSLFGSNSISISYSNSDFRDASGVTLGDESTLRVFRWNPTVLQWQLVGGDVDTALNTVTAAITETGVYGAFTTTSCCIGRVGDANGLAGDEPTIGDVSVLIDAVFISGTCEGIIPCLAEADVNQSGGSNPDCDDISIGDVFIMIDYLFVRGSDNVTLPKCM